MAVIEAVTYLDHVLDPTVRMLLDDGLDPDQGLHLTHTQKKRTHVSTQLFTLWLVTSLNHV